MQTEQSWMDLQDADESEAKKRYEYFNRPEPRENLSEIRLINDEYLGPKAKVRDVLVGMTRNAADENRKEFTAYLEPFPHIRIDKAKPLQGWYKALHEPPGVRPRPCFTEAILTEPYGGYCAVGCQFSLPAGELVDGPQGSKPIDQLEIGDIVYGKSPDGLVVETKVLGTSKHLKPEGYIRLRLGDLTVISLTADHPVYSAKSGTWIQARDVTRVQLRSSVVTTAKLLETVEGECVVYDIETETGNFYQRGVLVHNCYINNGMRGYRGSGLISVPLNYGEQVVGQLSKLYRCAAGYFSSFTDPFTPLEQYYHNTQEAAEAFVRVGLPIFFLSRLQYPEWAIDLLTKNKHSYAQKSLNTPDPEDWRKLSPGAMPLMEHMKEITKLKKRGIYISIQCNPIVAGVTSNNDILRLFKMLADAGADHVIVKFVESAYSWAPAIVEKMKKLFGKRGNLFEALYTDNIGTERTIEESYRLRAHDLFRREADKLGLTYATCYEYRYERDAQGKILNKTGVSIGRDYTSAEQCHGQRVPVYARQSLSDNFSPLEECPPSGCLYCAAENDGKPRCGDETMGEAKALRSVDLKQPLVQLGGLLSRKVAKPA